MLDASPRPYPGEPKVMLPALRGSLDFIPSPLEDQPGLVIRDPFLYSAATLIIPPALVPTLLLFDGNHSDADLRGQLEQITGDADTSALAAHLTETLSGAGFLDDDAFEQSRLDAEKRFADSPTRLAAHAGGGYPDQPAELTETFTGYLRNGDAATDNEESPTSRPGTTRAIAAPHVSPFGGIASYRAAYSALTPDDADRTFIILGTSHYGEPDRFGLTRKSFTTPLGATVPALDWIDELEAAAGPAIRMEDYCHAIEHSIEFQVVFLQHLFGPRIRVLPILCGPFSAVYQPGDPGRIESNRRMFDALGELAAREGERALWVLGVDMAHMGQRYGDGFSAEASQARMQQVEQADRKRIEAISSADADQFWDLVAKPLEGLGSSRRSAGTSAGTAPAREDSLRWCGSAPFYTFLRALPEARGELLHYQQWNIDPQSVVSFAGMRFHS